MCAETTASAKKRKWYTQCFKDEWLLDPEFKEWLRRDSTDKEASYCLCCKTHLKNANKSMLLAHRNSVKHKKCFESSKCTVKIDSFLKKNIIPESEQLAKAELLIAGYFSEHHIPFSQVDHLLDVCKNAFSDSKIAQAIKMKRTKLSYVIQDGIAYYEKLDISDICRKQKFSIMIDESTDISVTQILAIVVRYFDIQKLDVVDVLFDAVVVENGSAQGLYSALKSLLQERNIPLCNIIGFGSDNCSTMMGNKGGFQKLLKNDVPSIFVIGCVCHSFALCASHAVKILPSYLESFLKDLTSYFARSSKRQNDFRMIQSVVNTLKNKIPKLSQTRWLSRENVITVILEQWDALKLYFQSELKTDKVDGAKTIYEILSNRGTKHMLLFLQYVLRKVNTLNVEFQSEHFRLHVLYSMVTAEYKTILSFFIKDEVLMTVKLSEIDPSDSTYHKSFEDIYLGGRAMSHLAQEPLDNINESRFRSDCLKFLVEITLQIKKRFSLDDDGVIAKLKVLDPKIAHELSQSPASIITLATHFPSLVQEIQLNELDDEWRSFRLMKEWPSYPKNIPEFWYSLRNINDGLGNAKYGLLSEFMTNLTILPHSSAAVERIFSQINCVKNKFTNNLKTETVKDRILARQAITRKNMTCTTWEPKTELIRDVVDGSASKRYQKRQKDEKDSAENLNINKSIETDEDDCD